MNPYLPLTCFDIVIVPEHDHLTGPNVIQTLGAIHKLTELDLQESAQRLLPSLALLPRPYHVLLLGGNSPHCTYTDVIIKDIADKAIMALHKVGGSLLVTPSRRTPVALLSQLHQRLEGIPHFIWDNTGQNPYHGFLGLADTLYVTRDSISMVGEACFTGKPVYVMDIPLRTKKFDSFFDALYERHHARPFDLTCGDWEVKKLDEMRRILPQIRPLLPHNHL